MKRGFSWMSGAAALALVCGTASLAEAQNGPYYALPSWDQTLACPTENSCPRFIVVMSGEAVLDRETGLVWERSPESQIATFVQARLECPNRVYAHRKAWRSPSVEELSTLIDVAAAPSGSALPPGHPFLNVGAEFYWTSTEGFGSSLSAFVVRFEDGLVDTHTKDETNGIWCVRGGER